MLASRLPGPFESAGAKPWAHPSLKSVAESFAGADEVSILAPRLGLGDDPEEVNRKWLTGLLESGVNVRLYLQTRPDEAGCTRSTDARTALRHLYPYVESGHLSVWECTTLTEDHLAKMPRIWASDSGSAVFFSATEGTSMLGKPLPEPAYRSEWSPAVKDLLDPLSSAQQVPKELLEAWMPLKFWSLKASEDNRFEKVFGHLANTYIQSVEIRDPYCVASSQNLGSIGAFIELLAESAATIEKLSVISRELPERDDRWEPFHKVQERAAEELAGLGIEPEITVRPFRKARQFHDRTIDIVIIDDSGCSKRYRYDLTGGVDFLMSKGRDTKVYRYEQAG